MLCDKILGAELIVCPSKRMDVNECIAELQCPLDDGRVYRWSKITVEGSE